MIVTEECCALRIDAEAMREAALGVFGNDLHSPYAEAIRALPLPEPK